MATLISPKQARALVALTETAATIAALGRSLGEALELLLECTAVFGLCPFCDLDFGDEHQNHAEDCRLGQFLKGHRSTESVFQVLDVSGRVIYTDDAPTVHQEPQNPEN